MNVRASIRRNSLLVLVAWMVALILSGCKPSKRASEPISTSTPPPAPLNMSFFRRSRNNYTPSGSSAPAANPSGPSIPIATPYNGFGGVMAHAYYPSDSEPSAPPSVNPVFVDDGQPMYKV